MMVIIDDDDDDGYDSKVPLDPIGGCVVIIIITTVGDAEDAR